MPLMPILIVDLYSLYQGHTPNFLSNKNQSLNRKVTLYIYINLSLKKLEVHRRIPPLQMKLNVKLNLKMDYLPLSPSIIIIFLHAHLQMIPRLLIKFHPILQ